MGGGNGRGENLAEESGCPVKVEEVEESLIQEVLLGSLRYK